MREVNVGALIRLKGARHRLTAQQYKTLREHYGRKARAAIS